MESLPISVVLTTHNDDVGAWRALASVRGQTRQPAEIIVVDQGSTDATVAVAREHGARILRCEPEHFAASRERAIAVASHEWIALLDCASLWRPDKLERQWQAAESTESAQIVLCDVQPFIAGDAWQTRCRTPQSQGDPRSAVSLLFNDSPDGRSPVLMRRTVWQAVGGYDVTLDSFEDAELVLRAMRAHTAVIVDDVLSIRALNGSKTERAHRASLGISAIAARIRDDPERYPSGLGRTMERRAAQARRRAALLSLTEGDSDDALTLLRNAPRTHPVDLGLTALARVSRNMLCRRAGWNAVASATAAARLIRRAPVATATRTTVSSSPSADGRRVVALTFDDGPHARMTERLLTVLHELGVRATFFLIGMNALREPGLCRRIADAGMELATHSMTHPPLPLLDASMQQREIEAGARTLARVTGEMPRYFRPPYGAFDERTSSAAASAGLDMVLWNVNPYDWSDDDPARVASASISTTRTPAIVLLHEGHTGTIDALPAIVSAYRDAGYTFVTVSELPVQPAPDPSHLNARSSDGPRGALARFPHEIGDDLGSGFLFR